MNYWAEATFFAYSNEAQSGPHTAAEMRAMIRSHKLLPGAFFWKDGFADWVELFPSDRQQTGSPKQLARLAYFGVENPLASAWVFDLIDDDEKNPLLREKVRQWHADKMGLHPELFPPNPRTKEDLPRWRMLFGMEGIYGDEFRKPSGEQILAVLEHLDKDEPGWDKKAIGQADSAFAFGLADLYPELCKKGCTF